MIVNNSLFYEFKIDTGKQKSYLKNVGQILHKTNKQVLWPSNGPIAQVVRAPR